MLSVPMVAEGLGATTSLHYLNNGTAIGKLLMEKISICLYGYTYVGVFVSVCFEIGYILLSKMDHRPHLADTSEIF